MISVVVNSMNEGDKLATCLASVYGWADEIIVVDMESQDNTKEVAQKFEAKVFSHHALDYVEPVRKFAVSYATQKWILILDPDETVTQVLKARLSKITREDQIDAVNIPRLNIIFGAKIKHTNFWPDRHIRFFKKGRVIFSNKIHSYPLVKGKVLSLPAKEELSIHHTPYKTLSQYWIRMKRYSDIEASNLYAENALIFGPFYMSVYDFVRRYFRHLGFLDGWRGLVLSGMQFIYHLMVGFKLLKLQLKFK